MLPGEAWGIFLGPRGNNKVLQRPRPSRPLGYGSFLRAGGGRGGEIFGGTTSLVSCLGVGLGDPAHYGAPDPPADLIYPTENAPTRAPHEVPQTENIQSVQQTFSEGSHLRFDNHKRKRSNATSKFYDRK